MDGINCLLTFDKDNHRGISIFRYLVIDQIFSVCRYEMRHKSTSFLESVRIVRIDDLLIKCLFGIFVIAVSVRISYIMVCQINDTVFLSGCSKRNFAVEEVPFFHQLFSRASKHGFFGSLVFS